MGAVETVWKNEEAIWNAIQAGDAATAQSYYADSFLGWPEFAELPIDKKAADEALVELSEEQKLVCYRITNRADNHPSDDLVNVYYYFFATWDYIKQPKDTEVTSFVGDNRFSHVWQLTNGEWKIVAGTSAASGLDGGIS